MRPLRPVVRRPCATWTLDDAQAKRVRPHPRARGADPSRHIIQKRNHLERRGAGHGGRRVSCPVEQLDEVQVREALDVVESLRVLREDLDAAGVALRADRPDGLSAGS